MKTKNKEMDNKLVVLSLFFLGLLTMTGIIFLPILGIIFISKEVFKT